MHYFGRSRSDKHRQHRDTNSTSPNSNGGRNRVRFQLTPTIRVDHGRPRDMTPPPPPPSSRRRRHHHTSSSSSRRYYCRPAFITAAEELRSALEGAQKLCVKLVKLHEEQTKPLREFAGRRVLDAVWCARVTEVGEGGGVDGEDDEKGKSERQELGDVLEKVEKALARGATAKIWGIGENGGRGGVQEKRLMEKVKDTREIFPGLVDVALRKVEGMEDLISEMGLLEVMLKSLKKQRD